MKAAHQTRLIQSLARSFNLLSRPDARLMIGLSAAFERYVYDLNRATGLPLSQVRYRLRDLVKQSPFDLHDCYFIAIGQIWVDDYKDPYARAILEGTPL